jgi:S-adenosyl-L-methionine hydrolase (adenosine-forming)
MPRDRLAGGRGGRRAGRGRGGWVRSQLVTARAAPQPECLTFLTDFGLEDGFVAACHGVAARIAPAVRVIDITHLVPPGDIRRGAAVLAQTVTAIPPAVHVAVVDPGVGTTRRAVAVRAGDGILVGPDNGLLSWAADALGGTAAAFVLTNDKLWNHPVSPTFHGRDIFMPVAAHLAAGTRLEAAGTQIDVADLVGLSPPTNRMLDGEAEGEVLSVDRFGNVQLSIPSVAASELGIVIGSHLTIRCNRREITVPYLVTFGAAVPGQLIAFTDSAGLISLAVRSGSAAEKLSLPPGARVRIAADVSS